MPWDPAWLSSCLWPGPSLAPLMAGAAWHFKCFINIKDLFTQMAHKREKMFKLCSSWMCKSERGSDGRLVLSSGLAGITEKVVSASGRGRKGGALCPLGGRCRLRSPLEGGSATRGEQGSARSSDLSPPRDILPRVYHVAVDVAE